MASRPVLPALHGVLPELRAGRVVAVAEPGVLALAVVAGASAAGAWCAAVGLPGLGVRAAAALGVATDRLLLVGGPGRRWPDVVATLLEAVDVVLLAPPERPRADTVRRLTAVSRQAGSALVVVGAWDGAWVRLRVVDRAWVGLAGGHGRLAGCRATVAAEGRAAAGRPRLARLWLPGPSGGVDVVGHGGGVGVGIGDDRLGAAASGVGAGGRRRGPSRFGPAGAVRAGAASGGRPPVDVELAG